jgi:alcohol dehydrogenase, propanol-preferring
MRAMVLGRAGTPLELADIPVPQPDETDVLIDVIACGVCRTDLHIVDGELSSPKLPLVCGHQIVGRVRARGAAAHRFAIGERVGVGWMAWTCGACRYCTSGRENLCDAARFTGYDRDERFCFRIPESYPDLEAAPLLCAGLIGYRSLRMSGNAERLGIYGFGAAAHIVTQIARHEQRRIFAFTRAGDERAQAFARSLGAEWAGDSSSMPPTELDAAIVFAPVGALVPAALRAVAKGGTVVLGGIHMSDIPPMPYSILWGERTLRSVANLTRADGDAFMEIAARVPIHTHVEMFSLAAADEALERLRAGRIHGAAVLEIRRARRLRAGH